MLKIIAVLILWMPLNLNAIPVFQTTLPQIGSRLNTFHKVYTDNLNTLITKKNPTANDINKIIKNPFFAIISEFFNKKHFLASNTLSLKKCSVFEYCSICDQSDQYLSKSFNNAIRSINKNKHNKNLLQAFDKIIKKSSETIPLTKNKNYIPPKSVKELLLASFKEHKTGKSRYDKDYLLLNMITLLTMLENMAVAPPQHKEIESYFTKTFENDNQTYFQEALSCPLVSGITETKGKPTTKRKPPYKQHRKKTKKMLLDFTNTIRSSQKK